MGEPRVGVIHEGRGDSEEEESDSDGPILYTDDDDEDVPISKRHLNLSQTCRTLGGGFILAVVACCRRAGEPRQEKGHAGHEAGAAGAGG